MLLICRYKIKNKLTKLTNILKRLSLPGLSWASWAIWLCWARPNWRWAGQWLAS